jgi:hypothetical protein
MILPAIRIQVFGYTGKLYMEILKYSEMFWFSGN